MKIAITGGAGFVGSSLALHLKTNHPNYEVLCFDNLRRRGSELNISRLKENGIQFVHGDIRNPEDLMEIGDCDLIIDASADPSVLSGIQSPVLPLINTNLNGTVNILEYASTTKAKFIFLSTSRIYPVKPIESANYTELDTRFEWTNDQATPGISRQGISESYPLDGSRSFYGATKLASELLITEYAEHKGIETIVNRCGVISGPWQMGKIDQGVLILWLARHYFKGALSYIGYNGSGKQTRDVIHIQDLVELIDYQIHNFSTFSNITMNIGGGIETSFSLLELTALCENATGNKLNIQRITENRAADLRIYIGDNSKINQLCGWKPSRTVNQLVEDSYNWLTENEKQLKSILA
jgi:CDP-paratose 2-epimerase